MGNLDSISPESRQRYEQYLSHIEQMYESHRAGEFRFSPDALWLAITENCNLKCIGCYTEGRFKKIYLSIDEFRMMLTRDNRKFSLICLTEGEAFLHPQLCDILELCRQYHPNAVIWIITNGSIPIKGRYRKAVSMIDRLGISIDGSTKETYEQIRRNGNFERFLENVQEICLVRAETGFPKTLTFAFTALKTNLHELIGVVRLAHKFKLDGVGAQVMEICHDEVGERIRDIHFDKMPRVEAIAHLEAAQVEATRLGVRLHFSAAMNPKNLKSAPTIKSADERDLSVRMCQYLYVETSQLVKSNDGFQLLPCCYMDRDVVPVAAERYGFNYESVPSMEEVYNSEEFWRMRKDLAHGKLADFCRDCHASENYRWKKTS